MNFLPSSVDVKVINQFCGRHEFLQGHLVTTGEVKHDTVPPLKINMEPENHQIEKEPHLPSTSIFGFEMSIFQVSTSRVSGNQDSASHLEHFYVTLLRN